MQSFLKCAQSDPVLKTRTAFGLLLIARYAILTSRYLPIYLIFFFFSGPPRRRRRGKSPARPRAVRDAGQYTNGQDQGGAEEGERGKSRQRRTEQGPAV